MDLELLKSLVIITESKAPPVAAPKIAKDVELETEPKGGEDGDTSFAPEKTAFFFRPKFDVYSNLEQTENQELRRETKRVYSIFGREHERAAVYGITSGSEREFKRVARMLNISTDGEVTLERVKRAGFTLAGRIGTKRLMKRGGFVVSLVGPNDDQTAITFYTSKPVKVNESQLDLFGGTNLSDIIQDMEEEVKTALDRKAPPEEIRALLAKIRNTLGYSDLPSNQIAALAVANQRFVKMLKPLKGQG